MFSIIAIAGKTSLISSASVGCRSTYSLIDGRSPLRKRPRNSSASSSTRPELDPDSVTWCFLARRNANGRDAISHTSKLIEPWNARQHLLEALDRAQIPAARAGLGHAEDLGDLAGRK